MEIADSQLLNLNVYNHVIEERTDDKGRLSGSSSGDGDD